MELKRYQKRVLNDLDLFLRHLQESQNINTAYNRTWEDNGVPHK